MTIRGISFLYTVLLETKKRILFVDDDVAVSTVAAEMLRALGYMPVVAWGVESALAVWKETGRAFDLAMLDHNLGSDSGIALGQRLQAEKPGMPVLIASGLTEHNISIPSNMDFVAKPFSLAELQAAVHRALP